MARYIDAEKFIEHLKIHFDALYREDGELLDSDRVCIGEDVDDLIRMVNEHPTADVAEVKHGYFVRNERNIPKMKEFHEKGVALSMNEKSIFYTCSECREWISPSQKYCSECGAKMDIKTT